jgi:hypothetical protein
MKIIHRKKSEVSQMSQISSGKFEILTISSQKRFRGLGPIYFYLVNV